MDSHEEWFANRMPEQSENSTEYILLRTATHNDTWRYSGVLQDRLGRDGKQ